MKRLIVIVGLLSVVGVGMMRLFQSEEGTIETGAARAAESVRKQGPRVAEKVAAGIEKVGSATEKGASTLRDATEKGTETIRQMTSAEEEDGEPKPEAAT